MRNDSVALVSSVSIPRVPPQREGGGGGAGRCHPPPAPQGRNPPVPSRMTALITGVFRRRSMSDPPSRLHKSQLVIYLPALCVESPARPASKGVYTRGTGSRGNAGLAAPASPAGHGVQARRPLHPGAVLVPHVKHSIQPADGSRRWRVLWWPCRRTLKVDGGP
ncbi:hypothetical protein GWK47_031362 [Chionoecetes opilio]|uniref:Uncharacterized protein n=1 Tax=Chionoecetes opilio TaxID=41210 RepID=A0A8J5D174_CHIOP|nr:hypothetical protein GWK47_031362 [Chionoecetes opilio]